MKASDDVAEYSSHDDKLESERFDKRDHKRVILDAIQQEIESAALVAEAGLASPAELLIFHRDKGKKERTAVKHARCFIELDCLQWHLFTFTALRVMACSLV